MKVFILIVTSKVVFAALPQHGPTASFLMRLVLIGQMDHQSKTLSRNCWFTLPQFST